MKRESIESQLLEEGVYVSTTSGYSMWPLLRDRKDRVVIIAKGDARLKKWDLPLYRYPDGRLVLHRIIGVKEGYYRVRGDNTYSVERIPEEWILGYVTELYRGEKHVLSTSRSYRLYAAFWNWIYPLRLLWFKLRSLARRAAKKLFHSKKK